MLASPRLRLSNDDHTIFVEFDTSARSFLATISGVFMQYQRLGGGCSGKLQIQHRCHGWIDLYCDNCLLRVLSPMHIDPLRVHLGIRETLKLADTWPSEAEQNARRERLHREEQAMWERLERRRCFRLVK